MKKLMFALLILVITGVFDTTAARGYGVSFQVFYNNLSPYGRWVELDDNLVVWKPARHYNSFKPYVSGRWIWTNYGWYWDSYEPFGTIVYHYGRWMFDSYYGWVWAPDYEWAPAWVEWCYNDDYIGWAPMRPLIVYNTRFNYNYNFDRYRYRSFSFIRYRDFGSSRMNDRILRESDNERYINESRDRTEVTRDRDRVINGGVDREIIRRRGGSVDDERRIDVTGRDARSGDELVSKDDAVIRIKTVNRDDTNTQNRTDFNFEKRVARDDNDEGRDVKREVLSDREKNVTIDRKKEVISEDKKVKDESRTVDVRKKEITSERKSIKDESNVTNDRKKDITPERKNVKDESVITNERKKVTTVEVKRETVTDPNPRNIRKNTDVKAEKKNETIDRTKDRKVSTDSRNNVTQERKSVTNNERNVSRENSRKNETTDDQKRSRIR